MVVFRRQQNHLFFVTFTSGAVMVIMVYVAVFESEDVFPAWSVIVNCTSMVSFTFRPA